MWRQTASLIHRAGVRGYAAPRGGGGSAAAGAAAAKNMASNSRLERVKRLLLSSDKPPKVPAGTVDKLSDAAADYVRRSRALHHARRGEEAVKLRVKREALAALPADLRAAALELGNPVFPTNRHIRTKTPPIPNFRTAA